MYIVIGTLRSRVIFSALLFIVSVSATLLFHGYCLVGVIATHYLVVFAFFLCVFFQFMLASDPRSC
jgi:membrane-anchored protein YejM (alkaline phosphatase superfamily)